MKIIEQNRAPNPRRVRVFLAEKGITVRFEQIDIMSRQHKASDYTSLNPLQQVPTLVLDDGTAISESMAICRYFEDLHPSPPLMGTTPLDKALIEMWQRRIELALFLPIAHSFRHTHPAMAGLEVPQVPAWGEANRPRAQAMLRILDGELSRRRYMAGPAFTVADITALVAIDFMKPAKVDLPAGLASLERWYGEVSARPSAKA